MGTKPHEGPEYLLSSLENVPPMPLQPLLTVQHGSIPTPGGYPLSPPKRPAPIDDLRPLALNKRHFSAGNLTREQNVLQDKIFGNKAEKVEDFKTFTTWEDRLNDELEASKNEPVQKAELDWLIQSIPLEDRVGGKADFDETVMATAFLKCKADKLGNPVVPGMKVSLMQHQLFGVKWMIERENEQGLGQKFKFNRNRSASYGQAKAVRTVGGGLLADEMGLGKTIQSIAVMVHNHPEPYEPVKTTLIVAPLALIHQWKREIEKRTKKDLFKVHIHHGSGQLKTRNEFLQYDIVITTYGTLMAGYPSQKIPKKKGMTDAEKQHWLDWLEENKGIMFKISWFRVILDEAHYIKNPHVRCSQACGSLLAARKWCLTGTPVHNTLKDLYSVFRFLEVPVFSSFTHFKGHFQDNGAKIGAMRMQLVLRSLMLRRKKDDKIDGRPLIVLPEKEINLQYVEFDPDEMSLYKAVESQIKASINKYLEEDDVMKNYSTILAMLVRLRQLCIHPYLIIDHISQNWTSEDIESLLSDANSDKPSAALTKFIEEITGTPAGDWNECPLCLDVPTAPVMTICRHVFCSECINGVFEMPTARGMTDDDDDEVEEVGESIACPVCRHKLLRQDMGAFTAPKPKEEPKLTAAEATELYNNLTWDNLDDSDNESLPDVGSIFSKQSKVKKEATPFPAKSTAVQSQPAEIIDVSDDEDLFEVFRNNPVPRTAVKKDRARMSEHWATMLDVRKLLPSAKLVALRQQVADWLENYPEDKIIIFSQFVRALDLVEKVCEEEGWSCTRYQGNMKLDQRESSLRTFEDDGDVPIMLTSLKCGGVGLNLTVANRVICMDLWYNWQIENQAIDRVHRTGQTKSVSVARIVVKESVEERILALQEKKKELAAAALGDEASGRIGRLNIGELVGLFGTITRDRYGNMRVE